MAKRNGSDHFTQLARKQGYPARSVFKLEEIQKRFSVIRRGARVLDVGACPGSWSLYCKKEWGARIVAVDIANPGTRLQEKTTFLKGDILNQDVYDEIVKQGPYDAVISDAAPSTTGNRSVDTLRSLALAQRVWEIGGMTITPGGNILLKVFQGGRESEIFSEIRDAFRMARIFKPKASRKSSFEIYILGLGFSPKRA